MIAIQPVYLRVGRIYRKHSLFCCCVSVRVYRAVAWQRVDQIRYIILLLSPSFPPKCTLFKRYPDQNSFLVLPVLASRGNSFYLSA
jgi:hypothetical protein